MSFDVEQYVRSVEDEYDFPTSLSFNSYHEQSRGCDIVRVYFRYGPFSHIGAGSNTRGDKFGFEIASNDSSIQQKDALEDMKKREAHDGLTALENSWKAQFNYVYWQDVPYALNEQEGVFTVKCELCHAARSIDKPGDFEYRRDLYLIYLLKEIDHNCSDGWEAAGVNKDMWVAEGAHFPEVTERFI